MSLRSRISSTRFTSSVKPFASVGVDADAEHSELTAEPEHPPGVEDRTIVNPSELDDTFDEPQTIPGTGDRGTWHRDVVRRSAYRKPVDTGLGAAIENLYQAFARYPLIEDVSYCRDHCVTADQVATLHRTPLHEIDFQQMYALVANPGTWGDDLYFYHFAPRYLEIASRPGGQWMPMFSRMQSIWATGPDFVQPAMEEFMHAWWRHALSSPMSDDGWTARQLLEIIGDNERPADTYLAAWPTGTFADAHLADAILDPPRSYTPGSRLGHDLEAWLSGPAPVARLNAAVASAVEMGLSTEDIALLTCARDQHLNESRGANRLDHTPRIRPH